MISVNIYSIHYGIISTNLVQLLTSYEISTYYASDRGGIVFNVGGTWDCRAHCRMLYENIFVINVRLLTILE